MPDLPPLNALRAFEAAARHLSLRKAAEELHVSPGAISHQIRGLEALLGIDLFERRVRSVALTPAGKLLYPGVQSGFLHLREAVAGLKSTGDRRILVVSTPPGLTSNWLAPRLHRFAAAHPGIDTRISSSAAFANFSIDGVDVAVRNLPSRAPRDASLQSEKLMDLSFLPVCSPRLIGRPLHSAQSLGRLPLIHDDMLVAHPHVPTWAGWFKAAGVRGVDSDRGLRFNSSDHALEATCEGAGILLAVDLLAYDDLRTGRLVVAWPLMLPSGRAYHLVWLKRKKDTPQLQAFRAWIRKELGTIDWSDVPGMP